MEQQRLLASEMQRQVLELRNQRDEAREQALKVKEDAINDRHRHLQDPAFWGTAGTGVFAISLASQAKAVLVPSFTCFDALFLGDIMVC